MVALPEQTAADNLDEHRYLSAGDNEQMTGETWQGGSGDRVPWAPITALEILTLHQGCEPLGTERAYWIPREWIAVEDSLATRAMAANGAQTGGGRQTWCS